MAVADWSTTANSNGTTLGVNIAEGCDAANINNAIREAMAQLKTKLDAVDTAVIAAGSQDATLTAIAAITFAADTLLYATGADAFATTSITSVARTLLGKATVGAMLTQFGFAASGNATKGHIDIPFETFGTLRINWGSKSVGPNTSTTDTMHANFSTAFGAIGSNWDTDTNAGDNWFVGNVTTSTVGLTNGSSSATTTFTWLAWGLA